MLLERGSGFVSSLFMTARTLVRAADEKAKPNTERLREYTEAGLPSLEQSLFSEKPIYDDFEIITLSTSLTLLCAELGQANELVQKILAGKSPRDRAAELVTGSKLKSVDVRKKLYEGGKKEVDASDDPMIALAKLVDPEARRLRKIAESEISEVKRTSHAQLAKAKFAIEGDSLPDATFTLRLLRRGERLREAGKKVLIKPFSPVYTSGLQQNNKPPSTCRHGSNCVRTSWTYDAVQLHPHLRHHRRQLRQPGDQRERGSRGLIRLATFSRWSWIRVRRTTARAVSVHCKVSLRAARCTTPTASRTN